MLKQIELHFEGAQIVRLLIYFVLATRLGSVSCLWLAQDIWNAFH